MAKVELKAPIVEEISGIVNGAQRSCLAHEATACHQTRGQGVAYVANVLESGRHDAPHP